MEPNGNGKGWFQISAKFSLRDLILLLSILGTGGHSYYSITSINNLHSRINQLTNDLRDCKARTAELEDSSRRHDRQIKENEHRLTAPNVTRYYNDR